MVEKNLSRPEIDHYAEEFMRLRMRAALGLTFEKMLARPEHYIKVSLLRMSVWKGCEPLKSYGFGKIELN